ncbi:GNAT family N-acetyltransferase [Candidatus Bathyarchaeota archaeon]|nr:GNAT family N-acetyltransferase [Candidatus Bathyarchaeota archaeon]
MSAEDFDFAVQLTDTAGWQMIEEDFEFMTNLEPEGCFVLLKNSEKIGLATTISFDKIGWFGNLIIGEKYRKSGAGSTLVHHSIAYLARKQITTMGLYAYMDTVSFYKRLGFVFNSYFTVLQGKIKRSIRLKKAVDCKKAEKDDLYRICECDAHCFGASRKKLLKPILLDEANVCYTFKDKGKIQAYVLSKVWNNFAEIGPLVSPWGRSDVALSLLESLFKNLEGFEVSLAVQKKETALINALLKIGLEKQFCVARMFLNPPAALGCVYMPESLERG